MTEAETLLNETFARWHRASATVSNFRNAFTAVAATTSQHLEQEATELMRSLHEDPQWQGILVGIQTGAPATAASPSVYEKLGKIAGKGIFESSYASLDAAVVVFYHSLLDATVFDYCRVTAIHAPNDWEQDLKSAQVPLVDTREQSYDQLLKAKLDERLERLERESLLTKMDRLFARCSPPTGWSPMTGYQFDRSTIQNFDNQRHEIVHGKQLGQPLTLFPISDENLFYVQRTGMYFMGLVNLKYGLKIITEYWQQLISKTPST
jgi:hypothetical protein